MPGPTTGAHAIAYMQTRLPELLTTAEVAKALGISPRTLHRAIYAHAGVAPGRLLAMLRAIEAQRLLSEGMKVEAVALSVGYRTRASVYRLLRSAAGRTVADCRPAGFQGRGSVVYNGSRRKELAQKLAAPQCPDARGQG